MIPGSELNVDVETHILPLPTISSAKEIENAEIYNTQLERLCLLSIRILVHSMSFRFCPSMKIGLVWNMCFGKWIPEFSTKSYHFEFQYGGKCSTAVTEEVEDSVEY